MSFYHQGSANLLDDERPPPGVDVLPRRRGRPRLHAGLLAADPAAAAAADRSCPPTTTTSSRRSTPSMGFTTNVNLAHVPDEIGAVSRDFQVAALPLLDGPSADRARPEIRQRPEGEALDEHDPDRAHAAASADRHRRGPTRERLHRERVAGDT